GGIAEGDLIGLYVFNIVDQAAAGSPAPATPQNVAIPSLDANVTVIPEPATLGLLGIAGLGMFLARRKARR
ncbi:PEP-CTERM sorting domain-containing protein, partial [Pontiellaceae bacterium B12227]|nr:PEP-CTERM sorting domain-containing protein [Pontiellaceae bacterium B12227]